MAWLALTGDTPATGVDGIINDMVSALTDAGDKILGAIGDILPVALGVFVGIAVVMIGIGVFRRITGAKKAPTA